MADLDALRDRIRDFARAREWERFHTPKNLAMALSGEVGELLAEMQWMTDEEVVGALASDQDFRGRLESEIADVFIYLVRLADACDVALVPVAEAKIDTNERRYPADRARGSAVKYTSFED